MKPQNKDPFLAEIIESSLTTWTAQAWQWKQYPPFGSLVVAHTETKKIMGIVYAIATGAQDAHRTPYAYQKTEQELLAEQPHIFAFLKTAFSCATVGFTHQDTIIHQLCPQPPTLHTFVRLATTDELIMFLRSSDFLHLLFSAQLNHTIEELLLAFVQHTHTYQKISPACFNSFITTCIDTFYFLTNHDYRRLKLFLQRLEPLVTQA